MKNFWNNNKDQSWFVIVWLIIFFPVGLYLMFNHSEWGKIPKTIVTVGVAVMVFAITGNTEDTETSIASEDDTVTEEVEASEESDSDDVEEEPKEPEPQEEVANENDDSVEETEESEEAATEEKASDEETTTKDVEESEEETEEIEEDESVEENGTEEDEYIEHEVIDGVDVFTFTDESVISFNNQINNFSIKMTDLLSERHEEIKDDVIFRTISTVRDDEGNEKSIYTAQAYYSQETVNRINYDNWPQSVGEDLYNMADGVMVYHHLSNDTDIENKSPTNEPPELYYGIIGADYEE